MRARTSIVAASVAALTAAVAIGSASFGAPVVSTSTLTLSSPDSVGVVVAYTSRCTTAMDVARQLKGDTLACPKAWTIAAEYPASFPARLTAARTTLRDTVRIGKPICPATVALTAIVTPLHPVSKQPIVDKAGISRITIRCRNPTAAEAAFADSFPYKDYIRVLRTPWSFKAPAAVRDSMRREKLAKVTTAADSAAIEAEWAAVALGPDSVLLEQVPATDGSLFEVKVRQGYDWSLCEFARNKYTGVIINLYPIPDPLCEAQRVRAGAQRSANTGIVPDQFWKPPNRHS